MGRKRKQRNEIPRNGLDMETENEDGDEDGRIGSTI